jgi:hypothetical protein
VHPDIAEPITDVLPMGSLQNLQRTLVVDGEPVAVGLQPIGDALCHTNPTFAYGASVALDHGFALAAAADGDPRATALAFDDAVGRDDAARFESVSAEDHDRARMWKGEAVDFRDPGSSMALFLRMVAYAMAYEDADLFRAVARRLNGLERTDALERNSELVERARELVDRAEPRGPQGPTRDALLAAVAAA